MWKPRSDSTSSDSTSSDADWPMITTAVLESVMWREKKPIGQEGAWHRPQILTLNAASREDPEFRLTIYPATQYEVRFDQGDEAYRQMVFGTIGWTRFENYARCEHSRSVHSSDWWWQIYLKWQIPLSLILISEW